MMFKTDVAILNTQNNLKIVSLKIIIINKKYQLPYQSS